jgi:glycerol dehydrogenase
VVSRLLQDAQAAALKAVETQVVTSALERLAEANTLLSGLGFEGSGLAATNAVPNGLTAAPATHAFFHGEKVTCGLLVQLGLEDLPRAVVEEVLSFATEVRLPITLTDIRLADLPTELGSSKALS